MRLTERQQRELDYHRAQAKQFKHLLTQPVSYEAIESGQHRWWNAYWQMFRLLKSLRLAGRNILVLGCGYGQDALLLARLGARVHACDLSDESISLAKALAEREKLSIDFKQMPAEQLNYPDAFFDCVLARDILHHVDIPDALGEVVRVLAPGGIFIFNEIYTHSLLDRIRRSRFIDKILYPRMVRFVYGTARPYITPDERKLNEREVASILERFDSLMTHQYYDAIIGRIAPVNVFLSKLDRLCLRLAGPLARLLGGRVLAAGRIQKGAPE
mgnify:CR=1 FL=1